MKQESPFSPLLSIGIKVAFGLSIAYLVSWVVFLVLSIVQPAQHPFVFDVAWNPSANLPIVWSKLSGNVAASLRDEVAGRLSIQNFADWTHVGVWLYLILELALHAMPLLIVVQLMRFLQTVETGTLFTSANLPAIRHIARSVALIPLLSFLAQVVAANYLYLNIRFEFYSPAVRPTFDFGTFGLALLLWVVGHIYEAGVRLQEEQDLTI